MTQYEQKAYEGDLEIEEHLTFQRRQLVVQHVGLAAMLAIVVASILGLFGDGLFSVTTATDDTEALSVEYDRFVRSGADTELTITYEPADAASEPGQIAILIGADYVDNVQVDGLLPEPVEGIWSGEGVTYVFETADLSMPFELTLWLAPDEVGRYPGEVTVRRDDEDISVTFNQFGHF